MSTSTKSNYHHGELREALLQAAMRMLETGEQFSLRAVARETGVSQTAPYRHFSDRDALESALAARGFRDLLAALQEVAATSSARPAEYELAEYAVAYVEFALRRPALFRVMFGNACDEGSEERAAAVSTIHSVLRDAVSGMFPHADAAALASAGWALAHGLAYLHLDGKIPSASSTAPEAAAAAHVRAAFAAILTLKT